MTPGDGPILRLEPTAPPAVEAGRCVAVLDTTWTPPRNAPGATLALREVAARVLARRDLIAETSDALDAWAAASGVVDAMTADGTSYWYYVRLRHWIWLQERILWLAVLDELVRDVRPSAIETAAGVEAAAIEAAERIAARDGIPIGRPPPPKPADAGAPAAGPSPRRARSTTRRSLRDFVGRLLRRPPARPAKTLPPIDGDARRAATVRRLDRLAAEPGRLLVVLEHARQRVETADGPRFMNPYLGPIVQRLRGTRLEPVEIDIRARLGDDDAWARFNEAGAERVLPVDAAVLAGFDGASDRSREDAEERAARIERSRVPVIVSGVDLGPAITRRVAAEARRSLADQFRGAAANRVLLRRLRPSGLLLADEYHRQAWLAAAHAEGIPTAAVQHGLIFRWHNGYVHRDRPAALRLPDRTYVFGRWEREILVGQSVYRDDEVRVGGSPRLDLVRPGPVDREAVRREIGVAGGDRMVVLSGTWGPIQRRFQYPIALAGLFDRPVPGVHLVVKLHPGEPDEGPYRRVIEGVARAGGFAPPPISVVRSVDLYRLLAAADAHVGIHSTVLTEAVAAGTPNLLVDGLAGSDLLGYVEAGVAHPVRTGADLLAALEKGLGAAGDRGPAFLAAHFEPGDASERIAADLLAWL